MAAHGESWIRDGEDVDCSLFTVYGEKYSQAQDLYNEIYGPLIYDVYKDEDLVEDQIQDKENNEFHGEMDIARDEYTLKKSCDLFSSSLPPIHRRSTDEEGNPRISKKKEAGSDHQFEFDLDDFGGSKVRIVEPKFRLSLAELLDESRVVPISVYGNLDVKITGIQHDSRECLSSSKTEAILAAFSFFLYRIPPRTWRLIGVTGTNESSLDKICSSINDERKITHQSSSDKRLYLDDDDDDEGLGDDEIEYFLQSRNKRGRGSVGRRMDETGPYLPTEKVDQLQSSDTRERKSGESHSGYGVTVIEEPA
ncbi:hypothetical protein Bca52824_026523 [Brassica carinata]|uniref:Uncharacterized protein n=1 Tax=Brassica carinata TaxID=52824 RepID=A0A8X7SJV2_BRACI|nr:hypothetical protein Bca52824_026523 [Brassica carinata]